MRVESKTVTKDKLAFMYKEVHVVIGLTNDIKIIQGERVTSGRRVVVNSGRIFAVSSGACFDDSQIFPALSQGFSSEK